MDYCIKWQFYTSVLFFINAFITFFGAGYFYKSEHDQLALILMLIGCVFFGCGLVILLNSILTYERPETNQEEITIPLKRVQFSSRLQVYEDGSRSSDEGSDQVLLEESLTESSTANEESVDVRSDESNGIGNSEDLPGMEDLEQLNETDDLHSSESDQSIDGQQSLSNKDLVLFDDAPFSKNNEMLVNECDLVSDSSVMSDQVVHDKEVSFLHLERTNESGVFSEYEIQETAL